jgi:hypothetical protein
MGDDRQAIVDLAAADATAVEQEALNRQGSATPASSGPSSRSSVRPSFVGAAPVTNASPAGRHSFQTPWHRSGGPHRRADPLLLPRSYS